MSRNDQIFPDSEIIEQFFQSLAKNNIVPRYDFTPIMDGEIHRFSVEGDSSSNKSGAYKIFPRGKCPCWYIQDHRQQHDYMLQVLFDRHQSSISREEWSEASRDYNTPEAIAKREAEKKQRERREEAERKAAYQRACEEYRSANFTRALCHPYVQQKLKIHDENGYIIDELPTLGLFGCPEDFSCPISLGMVEKPIKGGPCKVGDLLIPLVDVETGEFRSLQRIERRPNDKGKYPKIFYKGLNLFRACFRFISPLGDSSSVIFLCEGFFTGYAVFFLTFGKHSVYCSMGISRLEEVAKHLRRIYPKKKIILMADDDKASELEGRPNAGVEKAEALKLGKFVDDVKLPPVIKGRENASVDWYDVLVEYRKIHR